MLRDRLRQLAGLSGSFYLRMALAAVISRIAVGGLVGLFTSLAQTNDWVLEYRYWISAGFYVVGIAMWVGIMLLTRSKKFYQVGDSHPVHNLLAFAGYCQEGYEIWASVYEDKEAPYRLASLSGQHLPCCKHKPFRIAGMGVQSPLDEAQHPAFPAGGQNKNQS